MKKLAITLLPLLLASCSNLTPEQNDRLLNAGIGIGTQIVENKLSGK
jgi:hypothetical protein